MKATNISLNQASNIAIIVAALKVIIKNALVSIIQRVLAELALRRLYRRFLRMMLLAERVTERHPAIANGVLCLLGMGLVLEVFLYA